jgi:hypothetical protein
MAPFNLFSRLPDSQKTLSDALLAVELEAHSSRCTETQKCEKEREKV